MADLVPLFEFDTTGLEHDAKLAAWARILPWFEVGRLDDVGDFDLHGDAWLLDGAVISVTRMPPVWLTRSAAKIAGDSRADFAIIVADAPWRMRIEKDRGRLIEPSQVCVLDNSRPFRVEASPGEYTIFNLPRPMLRSDRLPPALHGAVLHHTLSLVFADFISGLRSRLTTLTTAQAPALRRALRDLLVSCLIAGAETAQSRASDGSPLERAGWYIDSHLASALTVNDIASALGVSRSTLYRIFNEAGGVERFILKRRLARARALLTSDPGRRPRVREVAFATGFASATHFSRVFKAEFGVTPAAARLSRPQASMPAPPDAIARFVSWFDITDKRPT